MTRVYLGLGSSQERYRHLGLALDALQQRFHSLHLSPVYESEAVGFDGDPFLNMVVGFDTKTTLTDLVNTVRGIEDANGRVRDGIKFSARTLDIDILLYGDRVGSFNDVELPRPEICFNAFVLQPLADLAGTAIHPVEGRSYASMWAELDTQQGLWRVDFRWGERLISKAE